MTEKAKPEPACKPRTQEKCKRLKIGQCIECGGTGNKKVPDKDRGPYKQTR